MRRSPRIPIAVALVAAALTLAPTASAHVTKTIGPLRLTVGWRDEPALSGMQNAVEVGVADLTGAPIRVGADALTVAVGFGGERVTLPLLPAEGRPGVLQATLVPTRAGTYSFDVSGLVGRRRVDFGVACSERTFDCVTDSGEVEFPAADPSNGQLAQRLDRSLPRAEHAQDTATTARRVALAALVVAALALAAALGGLRLPRKRA